MQLPVASQREGGCSKVSAMQLAGWHSLPTGGEAQAALDPSQKPEEAQAPVPTTEHSFWGSVPALMGSQMPSSP